jgi:hypothetical protein
MSIALINLVRNWIPGIAMYGGKVFNYGKIMLSNIELIRGAFQLDNIQGDGRLFIDGEQLNGNMLTKN